MRWGASDEVVAGGASLGDGVNDALPLYLLLQLCKRGRDRDQHRPHGCGCVDFAAAEIENTEASTAAAELVGERQHVLRRATQPVKGSDDQGVASFECGEGGVELRSGCARARDVVVNVEVITADAGSNQLNFLSVCRLLPGRYARVSDELGHGCPFCCLITSPSHTITRDRLRHVVMRTRSPRNDAVVFSA